MITTAFSDCIILHLETCNHPWTAIRRYFSVFSRFSSLRNNPLNSELFKQTCLFFFYLFFCSPLTSSHTSHRNSPDVTFLSACSCEKAEAWEVVRGGRRGKYGWNWCSFSFLTANRCVWVSPCGCGPSCLKGELPSFLCQGMQKTSRLKPGRLATHRRS